MLLTPKERPKYRIRKYIRLLKTQARKINQTREGNAELRAKNARLVAELQKERIRCSSLFTEITHLRYENFNALSQVNSTRSSKSSILTDVSTMEVCFRDLATNMIQASNALASMQNSCTNIKAKVSNDLTSMNSTNSPSSNNCAIPQKQPRKLKLGQGQPLIINFRDSMDVIQETSHENSISPQTHTIEGSKYERRCKKGLCHVLNQRTRALGQKVAEESELQTNDPSNGTTEEIADGAKEEIAPVNHSKKSSVSSNSSAASSEDSASSSEDSASEGEFSPIRDHEHDSISDEPEEKSSIKSSLNESKKSLSKSFDSNLEFTNLGSPKESVGSMSFVNVKRGTNRRCSSPEINHSLEQLENTLVQSPKLDESKVLSLGSITYRRQHKISSRCRNPLDLNAEDNTITNDFDSKDQSWSDVEKENRTIVPGTEKKKARKVSKKPSSKTLDRSNLSKDNKKRMNENESLLNFDSSFKNSTPVDGEKQGRKKRQPLETIVSSTYISQNNSKNCRDNFNFNHGDSNLSLSPILKSEAVQRSFCDNSTTEGLDSLYGTCNNSSGARPRRNAAKNANYKEPNLHCKLRR